MGKLHCGSMVFATLAIVLAIVALATPAWMTGCLLYDNILAATKKLLKASGQDVPDTFDAGVAMLQGVKMCIHQGLFKVSLAISGMNFGMSLEVSSTPKHVFVTTVGLISGMLCMVFGLVLQIKASKSSCGSSDEEKSQARKETTRATSVICLATLLLVGCMMGYSIGTAPVVHQPIQYMAQFGQSIMGSLGSLGQGGAPDTNPFGRGRKKRDVDISGLDDTMQEYISTMVEGMDPVYGYSFIVGWVSVVVAVISLALSIAAKKTLARDNYSSGTPKANV